MTIADFIEARISEDEYAIANSPQLSDPYDVTPPFLTAEAIDRLKRECAAKRRIIELHAAFGRSSEVGASASWLALGAALEDLATVYSDHADYKPEWGA